MKIAFGMSWKDSKTTPAMACMLAFAALLYAAAPSAAQQEELSSAASNLVSVIVREIGGAGSAPEEAVIDAGGNVGRHIKIIDGFVAEIPANEVGHLSARPDVHSVTPNAPVRFLHHNAEHTKGGSKTAYNTFGEDMLRYVTNVAVGAKPYYDAGFTGKGIGVALIDTGVAPVPGLNGPGKIIDGPDLSFESQTHNLKHLDGYGHGTHLAGIIAGRDPDEMWSSTMTSLPFWGVAPGAHVINIKVGDAYGATDVSQIIAAIDWVVQHRNDAGLNIRVLNLSFGTDGVQDYRIDPLAYAAEVAWRKGIAVVVAAGNDGYGSTQLNNPAYDPFVMAVGGSDTKNTFDFADDTLGTFSSRGTAQRYPDFVAPGNSIVSLYPPGGVVDKAHGWKAKVGTRYFKGTGTSQAAAVVSGAVALLLEQRPALTPDQVRKLLISTATPLPSADVQSQGAGMVNLAAAFKTHAPNERQAAQPWELSTGTGSLEAARGSTHLYDGDIPLIGEMDIFGATWDGTKWSYESANEISWVDGYFNGNQWSGNQWSGNQWSSVLWSGNQWSGNQWSGNQWSGNQWSGNQWSDGDWLGNQWAGNQWSSTDPASWSSNMWSSGMWE
ncbi:MAG: S8 family serine peptidase [Actinomycetota bacterium]